MFLVTSVTTGFCGGPGSWINSDTLDPEEAPSLEKKELVHFGWRGVCSLWQLHTVLLKQNMGGVCRFSEYTEV